MDFSVTIDPSAGKASDRGTLLRGVAIDFMARPEYPG